jgi:hypothetical protein
VGECLVFAGMAVARVGLTKTSAVVAHDILVLARQPLALRRMPEAR